MLSKKEGYFDRREAISDKEQSLNVHYSRQMSGVIYMYIIFLLPERFLK